MAEPRPATRAVRALPARPRPAGPARGPRTGLSAAISAPRSAVASLRGPMRDIAPAPHPPGSPDRGPERRKRALPRRRPQGRSPLQAGGPQPGPLSRTGCAAATRPPRASTLRQVAPPGPHPWTPHPPCRSGLRRAGQPGCSPRQVASPASDRHRAERRSGLLPEAKSGKKGLPRMPPDPGAGDLRRLPGPGSRAAPAVPRACEARGRRRAVARRARPCLPRVRRVALPAAVSRPTSASRRMPWPAVGSPVEPGLRRPCRKRLCLRLPARARPLSANRGRCLASGLDLAPSGVPEASRRTAPPYACVPALVRSPLAAPVPAAQVGCEARGLPPPSCTSRTWDRSGQMPVA